MQRGSIICIVSEYLRGSLFGTAFLICRYAMGNVHRILWVSCGLRNAGLQQNGRPPKKLTRVKQHKWNKHRDCFPM